MLKEYLTIRLSIPRQSMMKFGTATLPVKQQRPELGGEYHAKLL